MSEKKKFIKVEVIMDDKEKNQDYKDFIKPMIGMAFLIAVTFPNNFPKEDLIMADSDNSIKWTLCENKVSKEDKLLLGDCERLIFEGKSRKKEKMTSELNYF